MFSRVSPPHSALTRSSFPATKNPPKKEKRKEKKKLSVSEGESRRDARCSQAGWQCAPVGCGCWRSPGAQDGAHARRCLPGCVAGCVINAGVRPPSSQLLRLQERAETLSAQLKLEEAENRRDALIDWRFDAVIGCFHPR